MRFAIMGVFLLESLAWGDVRGCKCDAAQPETMEARECGLCRETERQPADAAYYVLKDINPRKPNRWLVLPRFHNTGGHELSEMTAEQRLGFWNAAIEQGRKLWGDKWGLAVNGAESRTQCHAHIHVGRLLEGIETGKFVVVDGPEKIPAPSDGTGLWVHPEGAKLHVHLSEVITETVLLR